MDKIRAEEEIAAAKQAAIDEAARLAALEEEEKHRKKKKSGTSKAQIKRVYRRPTKVNLFVFPLCMGWVDLFLALCLGCAAQWVDVLANKRVDQCDFPQVAIAPMMVFSLRLIQVPLD